MEVLIEKFYSGFARLDADTMISCYHPNITFEDPAFGVLIGENAKSMWQMLCDSQKGKNFRITYSNIKANLNDGEAQWEAHYTFSKTHRKVHNKINAQFKFKDGLIINHQDNFNLHTWAKQALGFKGLLIGSTGFFKKQLQMQTNKALRNYINKKAH
ncbi:nuclear transport factor 2 family protein [Winogradskyella pelagia]|nr:nuclear transport factor 2 family protein [Winogradskyella sp. DF17]